MTNLTGAALDAHLARRRAGRYNHIRASWGHHPQHHELYPLLGLAPGQHLPDAGLPSRMVAGIMFRCDPAPSRPGGGRSGRPHRVRYLCEPCGTWVPFGRSMQHKCRCHSKVVNGQVLDMED